MVERVKASVNMLFRVIVFLLLIVSIGAEKEPVENEIIKDSNPSAVSISLFTETLCVPSLGVSISSKL